MAQYPADTPAANAWYFADIPDPVRHDSALSKSAPQQLPGALWNSFGVASFADLSAVNPTCEDGHNLSHVALKTFAPGAVPSGTPFVDFHQESITKKRITSRSLRRMGPTTQIHLCGPQQMDSMEQFVKNTKV